MFEFIESKFTNGDTQNGDHCKWGPIGQFFYIPNDTWDRKRTYLLATQYDPKLIMLSKGIKREVASFL
jgi:hypothetical protein